MGDVIRTIIGDPTSNPVENATSLYQNTPQFAELTPDQAALNANVPTDLPGVVLNVNPSEPCHLDVDFRVSATTSGATTGAGFDLLVDGAKFPGASCVMQTTAAAPSQASSGFRFRVPGLVPNGGLGTNGAYVVKVQYTMGAGAAMAIRPGSTNESCSLTVAGVLP